MMHDDIVPVIEEIHASLKRKAATLAVAESCTGGLISHLLTSLPGASSFFMGGVVCYSIEAKRIILGVSPEIISAYGVVSEEAAREMSEQVKFLMKTDYALAVTGNLGPDVLEDKPLGLVHIAVSADGLTVTAELLLKGQREENKAEASREALKLLMQTIKGLQ